MTAFHGVQAASKPGRSHLPRHTGVWCYRHKANHQRLKTHSKSFVARIGDLSIASCGDGALRPRTRRNLTQGFFALLVERKDLNTVRKEKGRLRSYLLTSVKHFLADESRHAMAVKRGKAQRLIPLDEIRKRDRIGVELHDALVADQIYE